MKLSEINWNDYENGRYFPWRQQHTHKHYAHVRNRPKMNFMLRSGLPNTLAVNEVVLQSFVSRPCNITATTKT